MHPQIIRSEPGFCPICHMELVLLRTPHEHDPETGEPVFTDGADPEMQAVDEGAGAGAPDPGTRNDRLLVRVEPSVIQRIGLTTEIVVKRTIAREIRAVAHVDFNETAQTIVNSRVSGWVEQLYVNYTGQLVTRGQPLAGIYSPELVSTQQEYLDLHRRLDEARAREASPVAIEDLEQLLAAARRRLALWQISEAQIRAIEQRGQVSRLLTLYSPYAGSVVEKHVVQGARITEGMDLFRIVDLSTVWAYAHIPEKDIPFVRQGLAVRLIATQLAGEEYSGQVSFIFPFIDSDSRDLKIRVSVPNPGFRLKPGMFATVVFRNQLPGEHLVIPSTAVIRTGTRDVTFVYLGNGAFEPREVTVGVDDGEGNFQIIEGLSEGEAVVVSGQFLLDSESRIQEAIRSLQSRGASGSAAGGHQH